eukprot:gnl/TRDRNA2_/TRDRNA2_161147_c0_seq1.p1 gnl/TRDRNA2_/TRDRNA2_161147_c0~~gnl/TRDRNA2_/TRDRNA2_161147_c0_seq1.p1  ORF type:complete len:322 (-),score=29.48 gnl/TRDRNA2_/TRDRNA2_161147_c0_seq1:121-1086(-)
METKFQLRKPMWPSMTKQSSGSTLQAHISSNSGQSRTPQNAAWVSGAFSAHWDLDGHWMSAGVLNLGQDEDAKGMWKFGRRSPRYALLMTIPCDEQGPEVEKMELLAANMRAAGRPILHAGCASNTTAFSESKNARVADIESDTFEELLNHSDVDTVLIAGDLSDGMLLTFGYRAFDWNFDVVLAEDALRWGTTSYPDGTTVFKQSFAHVAKTRDIVAQRSPSHSGRTGYICFNDTIFADPLADVVKVSSVSSCLTECDARKSCSKLTYDKLAGACSLSTEPVERSARVMPNASLHCIDSLSTHYWRYIDTASESSFYTSE